MLFMSLLKWMNKLFLNIIYLILKIKLKKLAGYWYPKCCPLYDTRTCFLGTVRTYVLGYKLPRGRYKYIYV